MNLQELQYQLSLGEDSSRQFKVDMRNADSLASEIAASRTPLHPSIKSVVKNLRSPTLHISHFTIHHSPHPYRGLGSGIKRALAEWPQIDFSSDESGNLFTATIIRKSTVKSESSGESSGETQNATKSSGETPERIIALITENPSITIPEMAKRINLTERAVVLTERAVVPSQRRHPKAMQVKALRENKKIHRVGPAKGGHWEVIEK